MGNETKVRTEPRVQAVAVALVEGGGWLQRDYLNVAPILAVLSEEAQQELGGLLTEAMDLERRRDELASADGPLSKRLDELARQMVTAEGDRAQELRDEWVRVKAEGDARPRLYEAAKQMAREARVAFLRAVGRLAYQEAVRLTQEYRAIPVGLRAEEYGGGPTLGGGVQWKSGPMNPDDVGRWMDLAEQGNLARQVHQYTERTLAELR